MLQASASSSRTSFTVFAACAFALLAILASVLPSSASAAQAHVFSTTIGSGPGSAAGQLSLVGGSSGSAGSGVAVDGESGDVFVADTANNRVDVFDPSKPVSEQFVRAWGWGVLDGKAELETCTSSCQAGIAGSEPGELAGPTFIAVDNSAGASKGDVYVAGPGVHLESPNNLITKFDAEGHLLESWGAKGQLNGPAGVPADQFGQVAGIAVSNETGGLWVRVDGTLNAPNAHIYKFDQAGGFLPPSIEVTGYSPQGLAVDDAGELFFSVDAERIDRRPGGTVYQAPGVTITGLAADPFTGDLYVDEAGSSILDVSPQCEPSLGGCRPTQVFGVGHLSEAAGLTAEPRSGTIYVADAAADRLAVFTVSLEANVHAADEVKATSATLHGEVNPEGVAVTSCSFQYGPSRSYGQGVPCLNASGVQVGTAADPITGSSLVALHADVQGLAAGTVYHFRLHAAGAGGDVHSEDEATPSTLPAALIEENSSSEVTAGSALLSAKVNPEGLPLSGCEFQYGTTLAYGTSVPCEQSLAAIGSGTTGVPVSVRLAGLTGETTYHWRLVLSDANLTTTGLDNTFIFFPPGPERVGGACPNEALRGESVVNPKTGLALSSELPDCRSYEMVTPPAKNGALIAVLLLSKPEVLAESGERVIGSTVQCFNDAQSCSGFREIAGALYEFARTPGGWAARSLGPPASAYAGATAWSFSADADTVLYGVPDAAGSEQFTARQPDGTLQAIGPVSGPEQPGALYGRFVSTSDLSHLVYASQNGAMWSFDGIGPAGKSAYEYVGAGNTQPLLLGVSGGAGSNDLISACGTSIGNENGTSYGVISADGRTVFFTAAKCGGGTGVNVGHVVPAAELYERVDQSHTVLVSAPAPAGEGCAAACAAQPAADAAFQAASADGSRVFFTSTQQLTDSASEDAHPGDSAVSGCLDTVGAGGCNLYESECPGHCENAAERRLLDVSGGDSSGLGPEVQGVVAISSDGSHVYFVAKGVLTANANQAGAKPLEGADNLYVYAGGQAAFIATLPASDEKNWNEGAVRANVTPDGRYLVFASHAALTADATRVGGLGPAQVYRYDAQSGVLARVSIGLDGFNDDGNAGVGDAQILPSQEGFRAQSAPGRLDPTMSHDGSRVFFESPVGLTPNALNDVPVNPRGQSKDLAQNIYEWTAPGAPGCSEAAGCVSLISDGRDASEGDGNGRTESAVELKGVDATGSNVVFTTTDPLVRQDTDTQSDFYDARVDGGFPAPTTPPLCETGDTCHEPTTPPETEPPLASQIFTGPGNLTPAITPPPPPQTKTAAQLRAEKLARALRRCHKDKNRTRRKKCERQARSRYTSKAKKITRRAK